MKQYVIIGNGIAGTGCIEGIRAIDPEGHITVITNEKYPVYCRPLISYYLEGKTDLHRIAYRSEDFYIKNQCDVLYNTSVRQILPDSRKVVLESGEEISYDALCAATGSTPFVPPIEGLESVLCKYSFLTLDDALALEKGVTKHSRVLIIGAGLIGLKCAEGLMGRVSSITVCDLATRVLSSIMDDECASMMQRRMEVNGISFLLGDSAVRFEQDTAIMKSGKKIEFDVLVLAVGIRPNVALLRDAGANCGRGILVDEHMCTSLKDVYSAGDCTESLDVSCGTTKIMALLPNACMQGRCAGQNMAGADQSLLQTIPMNSIGFFGLHAMTAGTCFSSEEGGEIVESRTAHAIRKFYLKNGYLTGYMLVGNVERAGIYTNLIRTKMPLSELQFLNLIKNPNFETFPSEYRRKIFGGVV